MPFEPRAGTLADWEKYVAELKELDKALQRAGVVDGVWGQAARVFRHSKHIRLQDLPYTERMSVVRDSWAKVLSETQRTEVGEQALTGIVRLKDVRLTMATPFTKEQLDYAGKAAIANFLKRDPKSYIDTFRSPMLETLKRYMTTPPHYERDRYGAQPFRYHWGAFDWATNATDKTVYQSYFGDTKISGLKADMIILDDPINTKGKKVKTVKPKPKTYNTVGVRFLRGHNLAKVYTYKVAKKTKLQLGEEIVVPSTFDGLTTNGIGVVVELHKEPQDTGPYNYVFVTGRIAKIAQ